MLLVVMVINYYVDDKFSKPFKSYLGEDAVYNFIGIMIKESKYCSDTMEKHFNKELVMKKKDNEYLESSTKCWVCDNDHIDGNVKVKDHCHITGKYNGSSHRDISHNINVKLNHRIPVVFYLSKEFDNNVLDLVKQKLFYPDEYMSKLENFKEQLTSKEKF